MRKDIIIIGGSAGGVEALRELVAYLPGDLPAAVLVVIHVPGGHPSQLPGILRSSGPLPCAHARQAEALEPRQIYVAPPGRHLLVQDGLLRLSSGPRENFSRPALDPLLRSAARWHGTRVAGVILSGLLDDGSRGLATVKAAGGAALVQDPQEALFASMPRAAIAACRVDAVLPVRELAARLVQLAAQDPSLPDTMSQGDVPMPTPQTPPDEHIQADIDAQAAGRARSGLGSIYSCPECGGVLWQVDEVGLKRFQCHTGHVYSPRALLAEKSRGLEALLWAAVRTLTEKQTLTRQLAGELRAQGQDAEVAEVEAMAELDVRNREVLRAMLEENPNPAGQEIVLEQALDRAAGSEPQDG